MMLISTPNTLFARNFDRLALILTGFLLTACQSTPVQQAPVSGPSLYPSTSQSNIPKQSQLLDKLYQQHNVWHGTPYQLGGSSRSGIDCSAFVQVTYRDLLGINLPRTTTDQYRSGPHVNRDELQTGDLVFFRHGRHVGIYLENHKFLHASTSQGVMISDMRNVYWSRHYWRSINVLPANYPR